MILKIRNIPNVKKVALICCEQQKLTNSNLDKKGISQKIWSSSQNPRKT